MRVLLVGLPGERALLRAKLAPAGHAVAGEFPSVAAARASGIEADGILMAARQDDDPVPNEPMTAREHEVLELLAEGWSNKAMAARLGISDQTIYSWRRQDRIDQGLETGLTSAEHAELLSARRLSQYSGHSSISRWQSMHRVVYGSALSLPTGIFAWHPSQRP